MGRGSFVAVSLAAALLAAASGCDKPGVEYERAQKTLQPTFDALTELRDETLLDPDVPKEGDIGKTIHEQVDRCSALAEKVAKLDADPTLYKDKSLVGMVTAIRRSLRDTSATDACKEAAVPDEANPLATLGRWKKCVDTCRAWFTNIERDAAIFSSNARTAGIDSKGIPKDTRFSR